MAALCIALAVTDRWLLQFMVIGFYQKAHTKKEAFSGTNHWRQSSGELFQGGCTKDPVTLRTILAVRRIQSHIWAL